MWLDVTMTIEALKREAAVLDEKSQKELLTFLVSLREARWAKQIREAGKNLDDPSTRWMTLDEVKAHLENIPEPPDE
jgi:hypothetical protein